MNSDEIRDYGRQKYEEYMARQDAARERRAAARAARDAERGERTERTRRVSPPWRNRRDDKDHR